MKRGMCFTAQYNYLHAATVEHEEKSKAAKHITARCNTVLLGVQQRERDHGLERWSKEMRLVRYCSMHSESTIVKQEVNGAANHAAVRWDT